MESVIQIHERIANICFCERITSQEGVFFNRCHQARNVYGLERGAAFKSHRFNRRQFRRQRDGR